MKISIVEHDVASKLHYLVLGVQGKVATEAYLKQKYAGVYLTSEKGFLISDETLSKKNSTSLSNKNYLSNKVMFFTRIADKIDKVKGYITNLNESNNTSDLPKYERQLGILEICRNSVKDEVIDMPAYERFVSSHKKNPNSTTKSVVDLENAFSRMNDAVNELDEIGFLKSYKDTDGFVMTDFDHLVMLSEKFNLDKENLIGCHDAIIEKQSNGKTATERLNELSDEKPSLNSRK